jgi:glycopeptide antibiotics resistance protein
VSAALNALLLSWNKPPAGLSDFIANLLLYVPLGFFGVLSLRSPLRLVLIAAFALALSTAVEIAQFFDVGRFTNMSDVYLNTSGAICGGLAGPLFEVRIRHRAQRISAMNPVPIALLLVLLVYQLYPYVPTIDAHQYWHSVRSALHPHLAFWLVFDYFAEWLTICYLVAAALRATFFVTALFAAFMFAAKIVIAGLALNASELVGAGCALLLWGGFPERLRSSAPLVFVLLGIMIFSVRLQPLDFHRPASSFGWVPFSGLVNGAAPNVLAACEKVFLYGSLIWIGARTGMRLWLSIALVILLLIVVDSLQSPLFLRSGEILDVLTVLLLGGAVAAIDRVAAGSLGNRMATPESR